VFGSASDVRHLGRRTRMVIEQAIAEVTGVEKRRELSLGGDESPFMPSPLVHTLSSSGFGLETSASETPLQASLDTADKLSKAVPCFSHAALPAPPHTHSHLGRSHAHMCMHGVGARLAIYSRECNSSRTKLSGRWTQWLVGCRKKVRRCSRWL
jgi:hypothetical protein